MQYTYKTSGTCSKTISFDLTRGIVSSISFTGGCNGNLKGISKLCEGQRAEDIIEKIKGTKCGFKQTSCPDQLAKALELALKGEL